MGKSSAAKRSQRKDSVDPISEDEHGADSEADVASLRTDAEASAPKCAKHVQRYVRLSNLRKILPHAALECVECDRQAGQSGGGKGDRPKGKKGKARAASHTDAQDAGLSVCLTCSSLFCDDESAAKHASAHHGTSRHPIAFSVRTQTCWCFECEAEVNPDQYDDIQTAVRLIAHHLKLKGPHAAGPSRAARKQLSKKVAESARATSGADDHNSSNAHVATTQPGPNKAAAAELVVSPSLSAVRGLANLGNTCFFNAVMQNMAKTRLLVDCLSRPSDTAGEDEDSLLLAGLFAVHLKDIGLVKVNVPLEPLTSALCGFLSDFLKGNQRGVVNPHALFGKVVEKAPRFKGFQQQDSHELLRYMLDSIRSEEIKRRKIAILRHHGIDPRADPKSVDDELKETVKAAGEEAAKSTFIDYIFGGELQSTVVCDVCKQRSITYEPFLDLSLPIPKETASSAPLPESSGIAEHGSTKHQQKRAQKEARKKAQQQKAAARRERHSSSATAPAAAGAESQGGPATEPADVEGVTEELGDLKLDGTPNEPDGEAEEGTANEAAAGNEGGHTIMGGEAGDADSKDTEGTTDAPGSGGVEEHATAPAAQEALPDSSLSPEPAGSDEEREGQKDSHAGHASDREDTPAAAAALPAGFTLYSCLQKLFAEEELLGDNQYLCEHCNRRRGRGKDGEKAVYCDARKRIAVSKLPHVLTLHLKRFEQIGHGQGLRKISRHVPFPLELSMAPFCKRDCTLPDGMQAHGPTTPGLRFRLYGIVEHSGSLRGGHYTAYVRLGDKEWAYASDGHISRVQEERVKSASASLLFYEYI